MKRHSLSLAGIVALLGFALLANLPVEERSERAVPGVHEVSATALPGIDSPLPASAIASGGFLLDSGSGRLGRQTASEAVRTPMVAGICCFPASGEHQDSHFFDITARLSRAGIDTAALGTPPPHA